MAEKVCCPGPIGGNNGNSAGGFREAVCVHTKKVYDSCRSKECLRDIRVYLTRDAQELINAGGIASVKPREAELLCVSIDVERIQFNRGFYSVDIRFFYRIECEISCVIGRPRIVESAVNRRRFPSLPQFSCNLSDLLQRKSQLFILLLHCCGQ